MKKIKTIKKWGIYQLNAREQAREGFSFAVIHPENMECNHNTDPRDTDVECESLEQAISWVKNY